MKQNIHFINKDRIASFSKKYICFVLLCLFQLFNLSAQSEEVTTTLTIENAQQTEYKKNEETGNDSIILTGSVVLSVKKGEIFSKIKADKISYDRKTEMLLAEGNVEISTSGGLDGAENASASSLLMNTSTLEGVFADGRIIQAKSDAINLPSGSTLIVFSEVFGKSESNTIAFKNSSLTFCDDENPHWRIDATRTWLLPGGEFAFFNALLYVGPVPVFYLPAFYYPKDELVFNPTFGYKQRAGYFVNTTTYLMGRKPLDSGSAASSSDSSDSLAALTNFMKSGSLKEQELQGLMLHNLDKDYSGDTSHYVKLMGDWYTNIGGMIGIDGNLAPSSKYVTNLKFNLGLGFSNTVFYQNGNYISLSSAGQKYWDKSNFLGMKLPFRYNGNLELTLSSPFKLTLNLPFYSDPYFSNDFKNRQESMDWISLLTSNTESSDTTISEISSFTWKLGSSYTIPVPDNLKSYFATSSVIVNSSINFSSATNKDIGSDERASKGDSWKSYTPERKFYYPSQVAPGTVTMNFSGTLFQYPNPSTASTRTPDFPVALLKPDEIKTSDDIKRDEALKLQEENKENIAEEKSDSKTADDKSSDEKISDNSSEEINIDPVLPEINGTIPSVSAISGLNYKLTYQFNPYLNTQLLYNTVDNPEAFNWKNIQAFMYTIKAPLTLTSNLSYGGNFFSMSNKLSYEPVWQKHPNTDGYTAEQKTSVIKADYNAESQNILNTNSLSFKPFVYLPIFSESGISYDSTAKLYRRKFIGDADNPEWENLGLDFTDPESITEHSLKFTIDAKEMNSKFSQRFVYSTSIAPQLPKHTFSLDLGFPYVTTSIGTSFQQKSEDDSTMVYNPLQQSININLLNNDLRFSESWNWNFMENHNDSLKLSLIYKQFNISYIMNYTTAYDFNSSSGWIAKTNKEFIPFSLSFNYTLPANEISLFSSDIKLAPTFNTSLVADLVRPTNSYFTFSPSITFKINDSFSLTFSSTSRNSVIYRYCQSMLGADGRIPGEQNPFIDLLNSFRFDNTALRRASGFKLKSLNMSVNHNLHDWDLSFSLKFEPRLVTKNGTKYYDYSPYVSLGVFWKPMSSIKTKIVDEYGTWKME